MSTGPAVAMIDMRFVVLEEDEDGAKLGRLGELVMVVLAQRTEDEGEKVVVLMLLKDDCSDACTYEDNAVEKEVEGDARVVFGK